MTHRNDNIIDILQFSYENDNSTARYTGGTSNAQAFSSALYTNTRLDSGLSDAILNDQFDLVLITGNPGDGKTAFLNRLANRGRTKRGRHIDILHDATQPQDDDRSALATEYLQMFMRDLTDEHWQPDIASRVRVIGINKGMLARTLLDPRGSYARRLGPLIRRSGSGNRDIKVLRVDLNDRALVHLPLGSGTSLLTRLVEKLTDSGLWEHGSNGQGCAGCPAEDVCPLLTNARLLRLSRPRRQVELLFAVAQFQRLRHVSLRDALAALAYLLVGHEDMYRGGRIGTGRPMHPCDYVQDRAAEERWGHLYRRLYYHSAFDDGDVFERYFDELGEEAEEQHRLYGFANQFVSEQLNAVDPARASNEHLDKIELEVVSNPVGTLSGAANWMSDLSGLERRIFDEISDRMRAIDERLTAGDVGDHEFQGLRESFLRLSYVVARAAKRRAFFFDDALADEDATPYESLAEFFDVLAYAAGSHDRRSVDAFDHAVESTIPGGIIASERVPLPDHIERLQVRLGDEHGSLGARVDFPLHEPRETLLRPKDANIDERHDYRPAPQADRYVEYFPTFVVYRPFEGRPEHLVITLDLYELLHRLHRGFSEAFGGQQRVQQLRVFKAALRARHARRLTLFDDEQKGLSVSVVVHESAPGTDRLPRVRFQ